MIFQSLLPASLSKPLTQNARTPPSNALFQLVNENFSLSTWLLLGCSIQALLFLVVPARFQIYAYSFAGTLLLFRVLNAILINFKVINNPYLQGGILKRTTALVADEAGSLVEPGKQGVTVLMLGAKSNHPFGFFAPEFLQTFAWVDKMNKEFDILEKMPKGFLGQTSYTRKDERGGMEFMFISYWRSIDDVLLFAHSPLHREAWTWLEKTTKEHAYIGFNHELYEAPPGHWENIYMNFQPTGLGATTVIKRGNGKLEAGVVADEWISPLVDANQRKVRTTSERLGRSTKSEFDRTDRG